MGSLRPDQEKIGTEKRRFHDPNLETLVHPQYGPKIESILQQVHEGSDVQPAYSSIMQMMTETASIDRKTGLYLGEAIMIKLGRLMDYSQEKGVPLTVAYLDADRFKEINDKISHDVGDKAILVIAKALNKTIREDEDIPGRLNEEGKPEDGIDEENPQARMGGDEFLIVLIGATAQQTVKILDRFREEFSKLAAKDVWEYYDTFGSEMTVSAGIAQYNPDADQNPLSLIKRAEIAMKKSKKEGRGKTTIADEVIKKPDLSTLQTFDQWLEEMGLEERKRQQYRNKLQLWREQGSSDEVITDRLQQDLVRI